MNTQLPNEQKYDPCNAKQEITDVKISVHCSRYWMLSEWNCNYMSFPFWRLYHSRIGGAYVGFKEKKTELAPGKIIIIPPNTSFYTRLNDTSNNEIEKISGIKIQSVSEIKYYAKKGLTDQFFVHFNLGFPFDSIKSGIYEYTLDSKTTCLIDKIEEERILNPGKIEFTDNINICCFILSYLRFIPFNPTPTIDNRILRIIDYIEKHIADQLTNKDLSYVANMATNSFARLFKENMNMTVQKYVQEKRVEQAILLLHHSHLGIDEIAENSGFYDRNHFSKLFKLRTGISPGIYKRKLYM
jgi:AraC-like DNA-binding protein